MKEDHTSNQNSWVETTLRSMSLTEKIGHLMCPTLGDKSEEQIAALMEKVPLGSAFFSDWDSESAALGIEALQKHARIPVLIAADMEAGPNFGTVFPNAMGCTAAQAEDQMFERGRITAREARAIGFHWSFAPCVDINYNFRNVETGLRSWGDRPETILRMVPALIRGTPPSTECSR